VQDVHFVRHSHPLDRFAFLKQFRTQNGRDMIISKQSGITPWPNHIPLYLHCLDCQSCHFHSAPFIYASLFRMPSNHDYISSIYIVALCDKYSIRCQICENTDSNKSRYVTYPFVIDRSNNILFLLPSYFSLSHPYYVRSSFYVFHTK
jgi:hypothetical protein